MNHNKKTATSTGIDGDTIADYAPCIDKRNNVCFAAEIHGYPGLNYAYVGGGMSVPLPAAVWLLGSGLLGLGGVGRKKK